MESFCSTCAQLLYSPRSQSSVLDKLDKPDKPDKFLPDSQAQSCCSRIICGLCIQKNPRFALYCPFCPVSRDAPPHLQSRPADPPPYTALRPIPTNSPLQRNGRLAPLPASWPLVSDTTTADDEKKVPVPFPQDTLHFLDHDRDTVASLSLSYGVPAQALRQANRLFSDQLLSGRRTIIIPGVLYPDGVSLSPRPVGGEDEEIRTSKIRRFMIICKEPEYNVALIYLEDRDYDLIAATEAYFEDEAWERSNQRTGTHKVSSSSRDQKEEDSGHKSWLYQLHRLLRY